jgi:hypothetical protein
MFRPCINLYVGINKNIKEFENNSTANLDIKTEDYDFHIIHHTGAIDVLEIHDNLFIEYQHYAELGLECAEDTIQHRLFDPEFDPEDDCVEEGKIYSILKTPFDWSKLDKYWWNKNVSDYYYADAMGLSRVKREIPKAKPINENTILGIIEEGESSVIEFKSALVYNFKTDFHSIGISKHVMKAICGFMNKSGGNVLIGVKDDYTIQGLEDYDFSLNYDSKKNDKTYFREQFDKSFKKFIGSHFSNLVELSFIHIKGKTIACIEVKPSDRPCFLTTERKITTDKGSYIEFTKHFFVRGTASTSEIFDPEALASYCIDRFGKR